MLEHWGWGWWGWPLGQVPGAGAGCFLSAYCQKTPYNFYFYLYFYLSFFYLGAFIFFSFIFFLIILFSSLEKIRGGGG